MIVTPDGARYMALVNRKRAPRPFNLRWLIPRLCGRSLARWRTAAIGGVVLAAAGTGLLAGDWRIGLAAGLMVGALPSSRFNIKNPVLVDAPAMGLAVLAAVAMHHGLWPLAIGLSLVAGCCKETAPVFAALYAWNPVLLVGALAPLARALVARPGPDVLDTENAWILAHPIQAGLKYHKMLWSDPMVMVLPWGGALAALTVLDWRLALILAVGYVQTLVATDTVRLYQWAAPVVCLAACVAVPVAWLPVLVVVTVWNPWRGNGV